MDFSCFYRAMLNPDELEPQKTKVKPVDLSTLSVHELEAYIKNLETEITRVQSLIQQKHNHLSAVEGLFKA
jgi:uncharacterized small protein (DUF1192 family)